MATFDPFRFGFAAIAWFVLSATISTGADDAARTSVREWGGAVYVDLAVGDSHRFLDRTIVLRAVEGDRAVVEVDGVRESLVVARRSRPKIVAGVRVFLADNRFVAKLTSDSSHPQAHQATTRDALLCISDAREPLLDPGRFTFPISREEGYKWSMEENSHMLAYLGPLRSHEGVDLDMHNARGFEKHALVAIEDGTVRWVESTLTNANEACVLLESAAHPGLSYIYMHVNRAMVLVAAGEKVTKGQHLGYVWGDSKWGHLHFSVVVHPADTPPKFTNRYTNLLNAFPQLFELWHGTSEPPPRRFTEGDFEFARQYWLNGNRQRLSAYDDVIGYGWRLGSWCPAAKVETSRNDSGVAPGQSAILRTKMHVDTPYPAENPHDHFVFEIAVENGNYAVQAEVGDRYGATWQRLAFEHIEAGTFALAHGERSWTRQTVVPVADGRLTVRIELQDPAMPAGLSALTFRRVASNTLSRSLGEPSGISQSSDQSSPVRAFGGDRDKPGPKPQSWTKLTFKNDSVAEELVDFPVLIKLDETRLKYADARPGGTNLRFMDADGITELPREIETWNPTGISIVWARVPQIEKAGTRDHIYMFLDAARDSSAGLGSVWNNSYLGVWHFDGLDDSSRHQHKGSNYGSEPVDGIYRSGAKLSSQPGKLYDPRSIPEHPSYRETFEKKLRVQAIIERMWGLGNYGWAGFQEIAARYFGHCTLIDDQVGRIVGELDRLGQLDNTIVVYTSDHGDCLGAHKLIEKGEFMYDEIYRIPMVVAHPACAAKGSVNSDFVYLHDLMPTFIEAGGARMPHDLDFRSILPALRGEPLVDARDDVFCIFDRHFTVANQRMVRTRTHQFTFNPGDIGELYDLEKDPWQLDNRHGDPRYEAVRRDLMARMDRHMEALGDPQLGWFRQIAPVY